MFLTINRRFFILYFRLFIPRIFIIFYLFFVCYQSMWVIRFVASMSALVCKITEKRSRRKRSDWRPASASNWIRSVIDCPLVFSYLLLNCPTSSFPLQVKSKYLFVSSAYPTIKVWILFTSHIYKYKSIYIYYI